MVTEQANRMRLGLVAAAMCCGLGSPAFADTVYGVLAGSYIESFNPTNLQAFAYFPTPSAAGVAYGDGSLYVSSGTSVTRYDSSGDALGSQVLPAGYTINSLASGGNTVYGVLAGSYIESFNPTNLQAFAYFPTPSATGVTYGDGSLYVSSGTTLTRYDTAGDVLASETLPAGYTIGSLTFGNGTVYGALAGNYTESFNPTDLVAFAYFSTPSVVGVTYGDNDLYVSSGTTVTRYDTDGDALASETLPPGYTIGDLAFAPSATSVPEPASVTMLALGLIGLGLAHRGRARLA